MSGLPEPGGITMMSSRPTPTLIYGWGRRRICDPYAVPLTFGDIQILESWHVYCHFHSLMHRRVFKNFLP
jgi:hypothetical protein